MSTADGFRQDMPPKEGYGRIQWERIPLKKPFSGIKMFLGYIAITTGAYFCYSLCISSRRNIRRENDDVTVALEPLLLAERDRIYLNQLRRNREEEAELMKNVPGWIVGTYFGDPVYKTVGNFLMDPITHEYHAHVDPNHQYYMHTYDLNF